MADRGVLLRDLGLALDRAAVDGGHEGDVLQRRGHDRALDREHLAGLAQRLLEVSGDVGHRHDEEVSKSVAVERAFLESMVEELLHQRLGVGEGDEALAEVARGKDAVLVAQPA